MKIVDFKETNIEIAKDQPQYITMPSHVDSEGTITACWELTFKEIWQLFKTRKIFIQILTFKNPVQPHRLSVVKPKLGE